MDAVSKTDLSSLGVRQHLVVVCILYVGAQRMCAAPVVTQYQHHIDVSGAWARSSSKLLGLIIESLRDEWIKFSISLIRVADTREHKQSQYLVQIPRCGVSSYAEMAVHRFPAP